MMRHFIFSHRFSILALVVILLMGCATTGPGGKKSFILIDTATEVSIGRETDLQVRQQSRMLTDTVWLNYVNGIGQNIVDKCDRRDIEYHFAIIDSNMINAFATPGGYVYLYTGLLKTMDNEAELAAVMAHEISHIVARHSIKRLQTAMGVALLQQLVLGESSEALNAAVNIGLGLSLASYSRENEREADSYGITYMTRAGYNPNGSVTMFEKLASMSDGSTNYFEGLISSHPDTQERIANVKAQINAMGNLSSLTYNTDKYRQMKARLR